MIEIYQLLYFNEVTKHMNYTRAAEALHLSRQALTKGIKKMEEELGEEIFKTENGVMTLTTYGRRFQTEAWTVLEAYERFQRAVQTSIKKKEKLLAITYSTGVALSLPDDFLTRFQIRNSDIRINIEETYAESSCTLVENGDAEIGFLGSIPEYLSAYDYVLVRETGMYVSVPACSHLAQRKELFIEDLKDELFVMAGARNHLQRYVESECEAAGFELNVFMTTSNVELMRKYAIENECLFFVFPPKLLPRKDENRRILPLRLPQSDQMNTYAIKKKGTILSEAGQRFWDYLQNWEA